MPGTDHSFLIDDFLHTNIPKVARTLFAANATLTIVETLGQAFVYCCEKHHHCRRANTFGASLHHQVTTILNE
jgi:hypothetical protein